MKEVAAYIESKQGEFMRHPFFEVLDKMTSLDEMSPFVYRLTFWVMTFQDMLRVNEQRIQDPFLKKIARHFRAEDAGHEKWFLHDRRYMGVIDKDSVEWLYSKEMREMRDVAYALMSESFHTRDEIQNIILLLTLESSGHVFFERTVKQLKITGDDDKLKYFSSHHLDVEMAHTAFENEIKSEIDVRVLANDTRRYAIDMIERCYASFNQMLDGLAQACQKPVQNNRTSSSNRDSAELHPA